MKNWKIEITDGEDIMGPCILVTMWNVLTCLTQIREKLPMGWTAEAYPEIR